ncbi:MAG: flagellar assembly protein FliW [Spirochaetaceae bacterium]|jgi:flagellar assembly factor FliW|nr:flagellar assembly protein FliW [Spirochaetaceae bacterium]
MKVLTKAYGSIEVDERQRVTFPFGLFGFESVKDYILIDAERQPFYWLQSLEAEHIAFIIINPFLFRPDYELDIDDDMVKDIGISSPDKALIFSIVTISPSGPMTANLQGPLIINRDTRIGKQGILTDPRWKTKHDILEELKQSGSERTVK